MRPKPKLGLFVLFGLSAVLGACRPKERHVAEPALVNADGNAEAGAQLVARFECKRCHEDVNSAAIPYQKNCVGCHRDVVSGKASASPEALNEWQQHVRHFVEVPSLADSAAKFRNGWVQRFLLQPHDVRPGLEERMPRLRLTAEQARDIARFIAPHDAVTTTTNGNPTNGRRALFEHGCGACHRLNGATIASAGVPLKLNAERLARAIRLAPDLAYTSQRVLPGYLRRWLLKPSAVRKDALMPDFPLSETEATDIAAYLASESPRRQQPKPFVRLPVLDRRVSFAEVRERVFRKTCWHCHSEPDYAIGDGGPGNTGGFGFAGRGVNLAEHETILAGYVDDNGERKSLFADEPGQRDGRLIQALLARHAEEEGAPEGPVRGMPLALPPLPAEDIQLLETWIAQGRSL